MTTSVEDVFIGDKLKQRRSLLGISQSRLGRYEGLTFQQIQKYETGKNRIGAGRLYRFSKLLHVPINYFFDGIEGNATKTKEVSYTNTNEIMIQEIKLGEEIRKLNKSFLKIKDGKLRKGVIELAKSLGECCGRVDSCDDGKKGRGRGKSSK